MSRVKVYFRIQPKCYSELIVSFRFIQFRYITVRCISFRYISFGYIHFRYITVRCILFGIFSFRYIQCRYIILGCTVFRYISFCFIQFRYITARCISLLLRNSKGLSLPLCITYASKVCAFFLSYVFATLVHVCKTYHCLRNH